MARKKKKKTAKKATRRKPRAAAKDKTATGRRARAPASRVKPRGSFTVNAACVHTSGSHKSNRNESHTIEGEPGGTLTGFWVSAGALVYGEPVTAAIGNQHFELTRTDKTALMKAPDGFPGEPLHQAVRYALPKPVKLAEGDTISLSWLNQSDKRCGHYIACDMKGK